jgi:chromosome segregation ATPase
VGAPRVRADLLESFSPFRVKDQVQPVGAVQVDFLYDELQAAASSPWDTWSRAFLFLAVVFALLFLLSLVRRPLTPEQRMMAQAPETARATATAPAPADDVQSEALDEELQVAREQLKQASEAFAFLEAKMKDGTAQASSVDVDAAMARIGELEAALRKAEHDTEEARSGSVSQDDLEQVRRDADERVAELQRQMKEDAAKPDPELEELRAKLADAERRAQTAEASLASARSDVVAAKQEVEAAAPEAAPVGLIEELEAKVAEAETRAKEAEEEALRITPEANDLRAKLAQAAARKKLGSSS